MERQKHYYTDECNAQVVIALLKAHGIRKVIANPGTTNIAFVGSVQNDPWFQVYSGVDERHSAYLAVGMAVESGEPVVLSCTGATASRNYLPALTEAFYRKVPVLAVTSMHDLDSVGQLLPQTLDRSVTPRDAVCRSVTLRTVRNDRDRAVCVRLANDAILALKRHGGGPAHINLEMGGCMTFNTQILPACRKIERVENWSQGTPPEIGGGERIALFVGAGKCPAAWERFAVAHDVAVFTGASSAYRGPNVVPSSLVCSQAGARENPLFKGLKPDLIIDTGEVSGDYPTIGFLTGEAPVWRVSEDGEIRSRCGIPHYVFEMSPEEFVAHYSEGAQRWKSEYATAWKNADADLRSRVPDIPYSNVWMARTMSGKIPSGSALHLGILNSLRSWSVFQPGRDVDVFSNVGGFGIDGCVSTLIGASLANPSRMCVGIVGDLAFFYDLNSLGNRFIGRNVRILLVNNGCGTEFNNYWHPGAQFGERTNDYIAAGGHFAQRSRTLVRHYAEDLGFKYLSAEDKDEFNGNIASFLDTESDKPIIMECFTEPKDESDAHWIIRHLKPFGGSPDTSFADQILGFLPHRVRALLRH